MRHGGIAQLVEHLLCKQGVSGSIPLISTIRSFYSGDICTLKTEQRKEEKQGNREAKRRQLIVELFEKEG